MRAWARLSLGQQVMLIVAAGLVLAQSLNFALSLRDRQAFSLESAAAPAISRLVDALDAFTAGSPPERRAPPRARVRVSERSPIASDSPRLERIEALVRARMTEDTQIAVGEVRAAMRTGPRGNRFLVISAQLESGQWLTARARGPAPIGPVIATLALQTLMILTVLLLPLLWLIRSVTRPLAALTGAANAWAADNWNALDAGKVDEPSAPRDVRDLVKAVNEMTARIAQMLREKDVMLGAIGHDLRTPLTALRIQVELVEDDSQRQGMIMAIDRLSEDLENILSLARSSAQVARVRCDLMELAATVVTDFHGRGAQVNLARGPALVAGVDAAAVRRAMTNLVDNAIRYAGEATIRLEHNRDVATIIIEDNGPGIPDTWLNAAAEAFVRVEPSRNRDTGGHGLGLAIVAAIARGHGGALRLSNRAETGLRAELDLKLA